MARTDSRPISPLANIPTSRSQAFDAEANRYIRSPYLTAKAAEAHRAISGRHTTGKVVLIT
jgi:hypothetical protein